MSTVNAEQLLQEMTSRIQRMEEQITQQAQQHAGEMERLCSEANAAAQAMQVGREQSAQDGHGRDRRHEFLTACAGRGPACVPREW